ncbi:MAG: DUF1476 domain-containing protein, partial [Rickettsiales bacterium]|nr:DUF1476 domain-containing protein [Rickettsiales bacterium]
MTTFDDRDKAFESKFALDKELEFKAQARATSHLALWAAARMNKSDADAHAYAAQMVEADLAEAGQEDVLKLILADLAKAGVNAAEKDVRRELENQLVLARTEKARLFVELYRQYDTTE